MVPAMASAPTVLVLHGITMSGASMLRSLGALGQRLEAAGLSLVAPNAGHRLSAAELEGLNAWMTARYREVGQSALGDFTDGRFWDAGEHYDWFEASTDRATGKKTYAALEASLQAVAQAVRGRSLVGVLGFSQGAAMAMIVAALALRGDERFAGLRWGMFLSGFKPVFDEPKLFTYPAGALPRLFAIGEHDAIFPGNLEYLRSLSGAFEGTDEELMVVPDFGHDVPQSPESVERLVEFALSRSGMR
jgi:pimeloyl-ACP methyl ester carboxylesterase